MDPLVLWFFFRQRLPFIRLYLYAMLAYASAGLVLCYLLFGLTQRNQVEQAAYDLAAERGHQIEKIEVKPSMGNLRLWRSVYLSRSNYYVDAIRAGLFSGLKIYPGGVVKAFDVSETFPDLEKETVQYKDIRIINEDKVTSFLNMLFGR